MRSSPAAAHADGRAPDGDAGHGPRRHHRLRRCPRLRDYCARIAREKKAAHRNDSYWGRPVPGFGDAAARLLLVGLAPAAHGANRTGRVFTGDGGRATSWPPGSTPPASPTSRSSTSADDGLTLHDAYILAAVRCAPPDNKPTPGEIARCRRHLAAEIAALPRVRVVVALGKIGHDAYLAYLAEAHGIRLRPRPECSRTPPRRALDRGCPCCWTATTPAGRTRTPRS